VTGLFGGTPVSRRAGSIRHDDSVLEDQGNPGHNDRRRSRNRNSQKPGVTEPEIQDPEPSKPEAQDPGLPKPEVHKSKFSEPPLPKPKRKKPDIPEPDIPEPDVTKPDIPEPDVTKPEVQKPDIPEPAFRSLMSWFWMTQSLKSGNQKLSPRPPSDVTGFSGRRSGPGLES
jgi:hypothetical protein